MARGKYTDIFGWNFPPDLVQTVYNICTFQEEYRNWEIKWTLSEKVNCWEQKLKTQKVFLWPTCTFCGVQHLCGDGAAVIFCIDVFVDIIMTHFNCIA